MLYAIILIALFATLSGVGLSWASKRFRPDSDTTVDKINSLLPQTQCGQCGYPGCRPYAKAIIADQADINQCPPGGDATIMALSQLLGREVKPLNEAYGSHSEKSVAKIIELECIGCTLCIQACPVDAIVGAAKCMHTVISSECTGCELCIAPCPVDCIEMVCTPQEIATWQWPAPVS